jgi:50S ribosomal protein L16 3-hydroxylase
LFSEANLVSPTLAAWLSTLRRDLDLSEQTYGRCLIYATPAEKGTAPHFDQNHNIVVQIHGTKRWALATNEHVIHPLTRHTIGQVEDPELATYCESAMPRAMPSKRQSIDLVPGSILYVPRGMWHQTTSIGQSLALNFTFTAPCWADLFVGALRSRLILSPAWRETAQGLIDPRNAREATRHLDALLADLVDDLPNWRAQEILAATESEYPFGDA